MAFMLMDIESLNEYCSAKPFTTQEFPFDEIHLVYKVMGKMFLLISLDNPTTISLKCEPQYALELREEYEGITGAFHFNKKYWNGVSLVSEEISVKLIKHLIDHSYDEVVKKLPKSKQLIIQNATPPSNRI